jgi:phage baseplate assembly protein gpV
MMQEFVQQVSDTVKRGIRGIHTAMPGKVLAFDPGKCVATVQPVMKFKKPDGKTIDFPQITGVPVVFPQGAGQNATIAFPVKAGDGCLIVVAEQSLDYWQYGQETDTDLAFDMTNAICVPGLFVQANAAVQAACAENAVVIKVGGTVLKVGSDGVTITGKLTVSGEVTGNGVALSTHIHTGDDGGKTSSPHKQF